VLCINQNIIPMRRFLVTIIIVFLSAGLTIIMQSCKRKLTIPILTTLNISGITQTSAVSGGIITDDGGADITARGVCWSTSQNPTTGSGKTSDGKGVGSFTSNLNGLSANIKYYIRAYAINSEGTSYGNEVSFTTNAILSATLTTTAVSAITSSTAVSGGNITDDGGGNISSRGVCWAAKANPVITDSKTINGTGTGSFTSQITGLLPGSAYHIRAYATNVAGTAYGNDLIFTALPDYAILTTLPVSAVTTTTAISGGNITSDGGSAVTARGVCWSTAASPTLSGSNTNDGAGIGVYTSSLTGLTPGTTYYVRAYATNNIGTKYGNVLPLTTQATKTVSDIDGNIYHYLTMGNQIWMTENIRTSKYRNGDPIPTGLGDASWNNATSGAYSIYDNDNLNNDSFGKLYNWYAVADSRHICPTGWHEPTREEWAILETYLTDNGFGFGGSGNDIAKSMAAASGWNESSLAGSIGYDKAGNNSSGFTALPGGFRHYNGSFNYVGSISFWWSITEGEPGSNVAWSRFLQNTSAILNNIQYDKHKGLSVRCVKD
jgi:uncharacterized protein (TIGR02145 family)